MMSNPDVLFGKPEAWYDREMYSYLYTTPSGEKMARIELDYIKEDSNRITTEVNVWWLLGQDDNGIQIAGPDSVNLLNSTKGQAGWGGTVKTCEEAMRDVSVDWQGGIGTVVRDAVRHFRNADPTVLMEREPSSDERKPFLVQPWVSATGTTLIYAPGGTGKSMIALGLGVSVATGMNMFGATPTTVGPVLYLDYEDEVGIHKERIDAICSAIGYEGQPEVYHMGLTKSVRSAIRQIKKAVIKYKAVLIVLDSVGLARGADPNSGGETIDLFKYLRDVGIPILAIDHVRKEHIEKIRGGNVDPNTVLAFGSQYSMSSSRLAWFLQELSTSTADKKMFNAHNTKHNHVPKQASRSLDMDLDYTQFGNITEARFTVDNDIHIDVTTVSVSERDTLVKVIGDAGKALTNAEIADIVARGTSTTNRWIGRELARETPHIERLKKDGRNVPYTLSHEGAGRYLEIGLENG